MAVKKQYKDWAAEARLEARILQSAMVKTMPVEWGGAIRSIAAHVHAEPVWRRSSAWLERLQAFKKIHGDALSWALSDADICQRSKDIAARVGDLMHLWPVDFSAADIAAARAGELVTVLPALLGEADQLDIVRIVCDSLGVDAPVAITAAGAVARGLSDAWWRRVLRKKVARVVEHGSIKLGIVNRVEGAYASSNAVERRGQQLKRNADMLKKAVMKNEAGQFFSLQELAAKSTANPAIRGGELMTRIRGCEEFAESQNHIGLFWTLTTPSRFHAVRVGGKTAAHRPRSNPLYDGISTPRDAQMWLRTMWARARAQLARLGVEVYGFRVAEPHHDGTPHWHALLWVKSQRDAILLQSVMWAHWLSDGGDERGAVDHRIQCKQMVGGGAAGYMAKYVAKNIGHFDVGDHIDDSDGLQAAVWSGDVKGWQRVDAWAATWGIRQFQAIGQPSVTVWRELRRVTGDQVEQARTTGHLNDAVAWRAWGAVHKVGAINACWMRYMLAMGGACLGRLAYLIQPAKRINEVVNAYGETVTQKRVVGVALQSGRWLISRRQAWARVFESVPQSPNERAACGAPWTGFNNCTARLGGALRAALLSINGGGMGGLYGVVGR